MANSLRSTDKIAHEAVTRWAERYPKAYNIRYTHFDQINHDGYMRIWDGRSIYVRKADRQIPIAANYPVQGAAASVMYAAIDAVYRRLDEAELDVKMAATVHDELILTAHPSHAEAAEKVLMDGMVEGWLRVFPGTDTANLLESAIGDTWAAK